jgi:hypothetical protein
MHKVRRIRGGPSTPPQACIRKRVNDMKHTWSAQKGMKMSFPLVGNLSSKKDCGQAAMTKIGRYFKVKD